MKKAEADLKFIQERKSTFLSYNISRLRELIRYLPAKKQELFDIIPFLLHANLPGLPGYQEDPETPCGIYRFNRSGFYKRGLRRFRIKGAESLSAGTTRYDIHGVYLMGSSGTIGQTDYSDFDYWLLIDKAFLNQKRLSKLQTKLIEIERWSRQKYHHAVKFFLLDIQDLRNNIFSAVDAESSGSAQKTLLKEEFYRTFMLIAGRIPYWAVLPSGLEDNVYRSRIEQIAAKTPLHAENFIDLGNLYTINRAECLGALLWQMYKAKNDPVKSLIKASLITYYYFFENHQNPICNRVKDGFSDRQLDSYSVDPYTVVFETVIGFLKTIQDLDGLELLKACVFLRLLGYPFASDTVVDSPKKDLLNRLIHEWGWSREKQARFESYEKWCEEEKRFFDERLFQKLTYFYELILGSRDRAARPFEMAPSDLKKLSSRVTARFGKKRGKLPWCSTWLQLKSRKKSFSISCRSDPTAGNRWCVHDEAPSVKNDEEALFMGHRLLEVIGWIFLNGFHNQSKASLVFQSNTCRISPRRAKKLCTEVCRFLTEETPDTADDGSCNQMVVFAKGNPSVFERNLLSSADLLIKNSAGEIYFRSLDLRSIENHLLQCYSISNAIWDYMKRVPSYALRYRIFEIKDPIGLNTAKTIEDLIGKIIKTTDQKGVEKLESYPSFNLMKGSPILDRFDGKWNEQYRSLNRGS